MNTTTLFQLAKKDNPVLACLANNWSKRHEHEPLSTLLAEAKDTRWALVSLMIQVLIIIAGYWFIWQKGSLDKIIGISVSNLWLLKFSATCGIFGFSGLFLRRLFQELSLCLPTKDWEGRTRIHKDAMEFLRAVSLLTSEKEDWAVSLETADLARLNKIAAGILREKARDVTRLQEIPWRKSEADEKRSEFLKDMGVLSDLTGIPTDMSIYFSDELFAEKFGLPRGGMAGD